MLHMNFHSDLSKDKLHSPSLTQFFTLPLEFEDNEESYNNN